MNTPELLGIDIIYDMYYKTVDINTNSQSGGISRVLPVQYIPRYGWVRMTNEMLRDGERMTWDIASKDWLFYLSPMEFCPYLSAGHRRFTYELTNNRHLSLFTHSHRAPTGSNYLAREFFGQLYRPGIQANTGTMPGHGGPLPTDFIFRIENGTCNRISTLRGFYSSQQIEERRFAEELVERPYLLDVLLEARLRNAPLFRTTYIGIGSHFDERTGNFYRGQHQAGQYPWIRITRDGETTYHRGYLSFENGYQIIHIRNQYGEKIIHSQNRISPDSPRYQTGCLFLNGFKTMELMMLEAPRQSH